MSGCSRRRHCILIWTRPWRTLDAFLPFEERLLKELADKIRFADCHLVTSDISPLEIAAAKRAGIGSILVENFTWDWRYEAYGRWYSFGWITMASWP